MTAATRAEATVFNPVLSTVFNPVRSAVGTLVNLPLKSTTEGTFTGVSSFTRATIATVQDFEGLIKTVLSGEVRFEGARRVENLIVDSEDISTANWADPDATVTGTSRVTIDAQNGRIEQTISSSSEHDGDDIVDRFEIRSISGNTSLHHNFTSAGAGTPFTITTDFQVFSFSGAQSGSTLQFRIQDRNASDFAVFELRKVQVEVATGQTNQNPSEYVSMDVLSSPFHGAGVDGVQYFETENGNTVTSNVVTEATGSAIAAATLKRYLREPAATNICLQSNDLDTTWTVVRAIAMAESATKFVDGSELMWALQDNSAGGSDTVFIQQIITIPGSVNVTYSKYVKSDQLTFCYLRTLAYDAGTNGITWFNLSTGAVGTQSGNHSNATIEAFPGSIFRVSITFQSVTDLVGQCITGVAMVDNSTLVDLDGTSSILCGGGQLETGSFPTSYIATITTSVTRNADALSYQTASNFEDTAGTVSADATAIDWTNAAGQILGDGTEAPLLADTTNSGIQSFDGTNTASGPSGTPSGTVSVAARWSGTSLEAIAGGVAGTPATYDGAFALAQLDIGQGLWSGNIGNVVILNKST